MEQLGDFLLKHIEGIGACCDHPVRFGVVESINTTHQSGAAPRARHEDAPLEIEVGHRPPDSVRSRLGALPDRSTTVPKSVKTCFSASPKRVVR
jgi:hypothetical protein